jgi:hypothetical protein
MARHLAVWEAPWRALLWLGLAVAWGLVFALGGGAVRALLAVGSLAIAAAELHRSRRRPLVVVDADGFTYRQRRFAFAELERCFAVGRTLHVTPVSGVSEQLSLLGVPRDRREALAAAIRSGLRDHGVRA